MDKLIIIFSMIVIVSCFKNNKYCAEKYLTICKNQSYPHHAGCVNSTGLVEGTALYKLDKKDRDYLLNYVNGIRNEIASSRKAANMDELKWNDEYEDLARLAIHSKRFSDCFWTENSKVLPMEIVIKKQAINTDGNWTITRTKGGSFDVLANPPFMNDVEFSKINNINYLLDEHKGEIMAEEFSSFHDPISNLIGCALDKSRNSTVDYKLLLCIVNARPNYLSTYYITGEPCTKCLEKLKCSKVFKNLCSSSDKFGISFWLMSCLIFLRFAKFIK